MTTESLRASRANPLPLADVPAQPLVWALLGKRPGDNSQIETLARATGLNWTPKRLLFRKGVEALPNLRRGGSLFSLTSATQATLRGSPPDVVIAAGKRSAPAALWVKARTGALLVHLGRTWAPAEWFDLVITTPQYRQPRSANVVENRFPLSAAPAPDDADIPDDLAALPRPRILIVVGGDAWPLAFDAAAARRLIEGALARRRDVEGSLLVVTSPRTPRDVIAASRALLQRSDAPFRLSIFGEGPNLYRAFLAAADEIVVTNDSASMIGEAAKTGRPVTLFALPERFDLARRAADAVGNCGPVARSVLLGLVRRGLIGSGRGLGDYGRALARDGLLDGGGAAAVLIACELADAARRVTALAGGRDGPGGRHGTREDGRR